VLYVGRVAHRSGIRRVLTEIGVVGHGEATREGARAFCRALEELGTTYIKLGQLLSSRSDLLPDVYIEELGRLVDAVEPAPFEHIERIVRDDLGDGVFASLDPQPLATASIAQTHRGLLANGREVVVKVRRPGVFEQVELDLEVLRSTALFLAGHSQAAGLVQLEELVDELEVHLRAELDFVEEAHNTEMMRRLVEPFDRLFVPEVIRPYTTERVLVLERIEGEKVTRSHGLSTDSGAELARQLFRAYVYQVVVEGVYHADPHHGNILLTADGRLALLDFGLVGRLDENTRTGLSLLLLALAQNRADDVADLIIALSVTDTRSDQPAFVQDVRRKLPQFHWRPLASIRAGQALADLQRVAFQRQIRLPPTFALVGKTLAQADAIARMLDPELDPVRFLEEESLQVMGHEAERQLAPNRLLANLYTQVAPLARLPGRLGHVLTALERGTLTVGVVPTGLEELEHHFRSIANRIGAAMIVGALLLASALLVRVTTFRWLGLAGFCLAALLGLYMIWKIVRTPGEL
jgi:predicted unusual protein kinase regulating ubiquinone biosynthesis (AarF/ABC1/UbiB family)